MGSDVYVSVDSGTSKVKAVAFDGDSRQLASASLPNAYKKLEGGGVEQDMRRTWEDAARVISEVAGKVPDLGRRAVALAISGQGDGTWLMDGKGAPVGDALLWLDVRSGDIVRNAQSDGSGDVVYQNTGCGLNASNQSSQLAWLKQTEPQRLAAADCAMHCKDWLYYNLTGQRCTDLSEGLFTFGDYRNRRYSDDILEALGIGDCRRLLPLMLDGCSTQHPLTGAAADATGLPQGLPVTLGSVDVVCSALGGGIYSPEGRAGCSIIGTTGMHMRFFADASEVVFGAEPNGYTMVPAGFGDALLRMQSNMSATLNIDWLARLFCEVAGAFGNKVGEDQAIALFDDLIGGSSTNVIYHPYIEAGERGPFFNPEARAQFSGISSGHGAKDLVRAVFEGLAFASRHCYESLGDVPDEVRLCGGGARSKMLRQALANVLGADIRPSNMDETCAVGAMMMAAVAVGRFTDMASACQTWVDRELGDATSPQQETRGRYDALYDAYNMAAKTGPPVWARLAKAI